MDKGGKIITRFWKEVQSIPYLSISYILSLHGINIALGSKLAPKKEQKMMQVK